MKHSNYETVKIVIAGMDIDFIMVKHPGEVMASGFVQQPMAVAWFDEK